MIKKPTKAATPKRQAKKNQQPAVISWRFAFVIVALLGVFSALVIRSAYLQVIEPEMLLEQGDARTLRVKADAAMRGMILDRHGEELAVSVPSHTPLMREAADRLADAMSGLAWSMPAIPVVQNVDGRVHQSVDAIRQALVQQLYLPVQWTSCVQALVAHGVTQVVECGPGKVLSGLVKRIDKSVEARPMGTPAEFAAALDAWVH